MIRPSLLGWLEEELAVCGDLDIVRVSFPAIDLSQMLEYVKHLEDPPDDMVCYCKCPCMACNTWHE